MPVILAFLPPSTFKVHSALHPTGVRSLGDYTTKETPHCYCVNLVAFSDDCSYSACKGHHLLCPLLTTKLAKLEGKAERASLPDSRPPLCPAINCPKWTLMLKVLFTCRIAFCICTEPSSDRNCLWQGMKAGHQSSVFSCAMMDNNEDQN